MLTLPPSLQITRNTKAERRLIDKTRTWLTSQERDPRIHASDLLDPRKAYWDRLHPQTLSDKLVGLFFVGKVLHAFFISALNGEKGTNWESDAGSVFDKTLKICWSNDWEDKTVTPHIPYEFKTSRSKYEQKKRDLWLTANSS